MLVAQSYPTLQDPMDCCPPGSSFHGIFQARILEWVAISFSRGSSGPRNRAWVSCIAGGFFTYWARREALRVILDGMYFLSSKFSVLSPPLLCLPSSLLPKHLCPDALRWSQTRVASAQGVWEPSTCGGGWCVGPECVEGVCVQWCGLVSMAELS